VVSGFACFHGFGRPCMNLTTAARARALQSGGIPYLHLSKLKDIEYRKKIALFVVHLYPWASCVHLCVLENLLEITLFRDHRHCAF
jgi:hypothetical protein